MGIPTAAYTMGTFQYFLLYTCPRPGSTAEYRAALRGLNTRSLAVSALVAGGTGFGATTVPAASFTTSESLPCADASTGTIRIKEIANNAFIMHAYLS
jgi:hypothetical protein